MNKKLTPVILKFLLHCYTNADNLDFDLSPYATEIDEFVAQGVLKRDSAWGAGIASNFICRTTPLGDAWIKSILSTPMPTAAFIDANGAVIQ
jgi:hypothetical protein